MKSIELMNKNLIHLGPLSPGIEILKRLEDAPVIPA